MKPEENSYIFIVDTDKYSGNFERDLTAFCTGQVGECERGEEYAELFRKECPEWANLFNDLCEDRPDEHGCRRPTAIWPTPGYLNDGHGNHYKEVVGNEKQNCWPAYQSVAMFFYTEPTIKTLQFLMQRARQYKPLNEFDGSFTILGFRLVQEVTTEKFVWESKP